MWWLVFTWTLLMSAVGTFAAEGTLDVVWLTSPYTFGYSNETHYTTKEILKMLTTKIAKRQPSAWFGLAYFFGEKHQCYQRVMPLTGDLPAFHAAVDRHDHVLPNRWEASPYQGLNQCANDLAMKWSSTTKDLTAVKFFIITASLDPAPDPSFWGDFLHCGSTLEQDYPTDRGVSGHDAYIIAIAEKKHVVGLWNQEFEKRHVPGAAVPLEELLGTDVNMAAEQLYSVFQNHVDDVFNPKPKKFVISPWRLAFEKFLWYF